MLNLKKKKKSQTWRVVSEDQSACLLQDCSYGNKLQWEGCMCMGQPVERSIGLGMNSFLMHDRRRVYHPTAIITYIYTSVNRKHKSNCKSALGSKWKRLIADLTWTSIKRLQNKRAAWQDQSTVNCLIWRNKDSARKEGGGVDRWRALCVCM